MYFFGDLQGLNFCLSSLHSNLAPLVGEENLNLAVVALTLPFGPDLIFVLGAVTTPQSESRVGAQTTSGLGLSPPLLLGSETVVAVESSEVPPAVLVCVAATIVPPGIEEA